MMIEGFFIWMAGVAFGLSLALAIMQKQKNDAALREYRELSKRLENEMIAVASLHAIIIKRLVRTEAILAEHFIDS